MTPEERRWLVEKPFPTVRVHTTTYPYAGCLINRWDDDGLSRKLERGMSLAPSPLEEVIELFGGVGDE